MVATSAKLAWLDERLKEQRPESETQVLRAIRADVWQMHELRTIDQAEIASVELAKDETA